MAGLFDVVEDDFVDVEEYKPGLEAGTYEAIVSNVGTEQKDSGLYLVITYTVTDGKDKGRTHKEFQLIPQGRATTENEVKALRFIKTRMLSLGVPEDRINSVEPDEIQGTEVAITLVDQRKDPRYKNVSRVVLLSGGGADVPTLPGTSSDDSGEAGKGSNPYA